jgi:hypothetical protein
LGKPYASELESLGATYDWALDSGIKELTRGIAACAGLPLIVVGSGGSLTAAHYAAALHQGMTGRVAKAVTPLELVNSGLWAKDAAIMFLSAGGGNPDVIGAFKQAAAREPQRLVVVCSRRQSPLSEECGKYRYADLIDFDLPTGKDGFLATNSLLAFSVLLYQAWAKAFCVDDDLPRPLAELVHPGRPEEDWPSDLAARCQPLWPRETLSVLYGLSTQAAALDVESKFTEAALGSVQMADYRNFAHGRHLWLAKRGETTGVLALITSEDSQLADKTLRLIPPDIPVARVEVPHVGPKAGLAALVAVLHLVGYAGQARGIDPGRPGVPPFGSRIYNLRAFGTPSSSNNTASRLEAVSIERKTGTTMGQLAACGELEFWKGKYASFCERLGGGSYAAVVFDYDGTLCDGRDRYEGFGDEVSGHLVRLLEAGIFIGIATGRGKSAKDDFRRRLPRPLWSRVMMGYYNCADNGLLDDDMYPNGTTGTCSDLEPVARLLESSGALKRLAKCTYRDMQITIEPTGLAPTPLVWEVVQQIVQEAGVYGVAVVRSSHSVDVLAPRVTKQEIVRRVQEVLGSGESTPVLCVGDRGRWPGNDFALLKGHYSLSVDEVSPDPESCWNLAPPGHRGVQATLGYLKALRFEKSAVRIIVPQNSRRL